MGRKFKKPKSPFAALDDEFKTLIENGTDEQIRAKISEVALNEVVNQETKKADQDLREKADAARLAGEGYKEATKMNRLRIAYSKMILDARGKI